MASRPSVYQTDPAFARSVDNLSGALFGNPAGEAAYAESLGNQYVNAEKVTGARRSRRTLDRLGSAVQDGRMGDALGFAAQTGDSALLGQVPGTNLAWGAQDFDGTSDAQLQRLFVGTGKTWGPTDATSVDQSEERLSSAFTRASALEQERGRTARQQSGPMSTDEFAAQQFNAGTPLNEQQMAVIGQRGFAPQDPIRMDADTFQTLDVYVSSIFPENAPIDPTTKGALITRSGEYYSNPNSPAYGDIAQSVGLAQQDVVGPETQTLGNWNPLKSNFTAPADNYKPPVPSFMRGLAPPTPAEGSPRTVIQDNDDAAYNALPPGAVFFDAQGNQYQKPQR